MLIDVLGTIPFFAIGKRWLLAFRLLRLFKFTTYMSRMNNLITHLQQKLE